jgi:hypothetical protein
VLARACSEAVADIGDAHGGGVVRRQFVSICRGIFKILIVVKFGFRRSLLVIQLTKFTDGWDHGYQAAYF